MTAKVFPQYRAALSSAGGAFALGTTMGWSSSVQDQLENGEYGFTVDSEAFSWISSILMLGGLCACIPIGFIIKCIGRRLTMLLLVIPFCIGWLLMIFATNVIMLCVARFFLGIAGGSFCICCPVYTAEIAQKEIRGTLGTFFQLLLTSGVLFAYVSGAIVKIHVLNYILAVVPLIFGIFFAPNPESPVYLITKGKDEKALSALQRLRGRDDCIDELNEIKTAKTKAKENRLSFIKILFRRSTLKALLISLFLIVTLQLSGINAIVFYSKYIFEESDLHNSASIASIAIAVIMVCAAFCSSFTIDRFGRRILLFPSLLFMSLATLLFGFYFYKMEQDKTSIESIRWLPIVSLCIFIMAFCSGPGAVTWVLISEILSNEVRDIAVSLCGMTNWTLAFLVTKNFIALQHIIGEGEVFWIFSMVSALGVVVTFFFIPETKGKTFSEIEQKLES